MSEAATPVETPAAAPPPAPTKQSREAAAAEYLPRKTNGQFVKRTEAELAPKGEAKPEAAEPEKPEAPPAEEAKAEATPEPVSKAFISLKRQRREIAEKERIVQRREMTLAAAQREHAELKELAAKDPWEFARRMGFNARDVAKRAVDESSETPEAKMLKESKSELEALKAELKELREGFTTKTEAEKVSADVQAVRSVVALHECPYLQDEPIEEVTQAFKTVYLRDYEPAGLPLNKENVKAILDFMEGNLRGMYEGKVQRVQKTRGVEQSAPSARENGAVKSAKHDVTLSNIEAAQVAKAPSSLSITDPKSAKERKERALALMRFKESD